MKLENAKTRETTDDLKSRPVRTNRVSLFLEGLRDEITYLNLDQLVSYRHQARTTFDETDLVALSDTIKDVGIRQPLTVLPAENEKYEIISGERRFRAAKMAGLDRVPCIVTKDRNQAETIALIENIQRSDLTLLELGEGLKGLLERGTFSSQSAMADKLGISRTKVVECIALANLDGTVKNSIKMNRNISRDALRKILTFSTKEQQLEQANSLDIASEPGAEGEKQGTKASSSSSSLIRISLTEGELKLQKKRLLTINEDQKEKLKHILSSLLAELS